MFLRELDHVRDLFDSVNGAFVGVGITAFPRIIPSYFLDSYRIITLRKTGDLPQLRNKAEIFCLEEEIGGSLPTDSRDSAHLLAHQSVKRYLNKLPEPKHLLLYQNYPDLEKLAEKQGWILLANRADLRLRLRERAFFQQMAAGLDLRLVPGAIWPIEVIRERSYEEWASILGPQLVIQLPDIGQGGGRGTFFVRSAEAYDLLKKRLRGDIWREVRLKSVSVRKFMEGIPVSMAICITRHGILTSGLQEQLVDLAYCSDFLEDGIFCGHVWDETRWSLAIQEDALKQANRIGEYVASLGYRGILGIDFIIDEGGREICPIEINPRFTGAFPMLSLLHLQNGIIPLDIFHMLEFLDLPYQLDVEELNKQYARPIKGSHLLLFLPPGGQKVRFDRLLPGLYEYEPGEKRFFFRRDAMEYRDIQNENQFVLVDGPPNIGGSGAVSTDPLGRLCHMLFSYPVVDKDGAMSLHARVVLEWVYGIGD
ncbi:MAG: ATP-grasp domain-containing protein [Desulfobacteraceae bacterium]|nr:ATP-grasp domain-containing protein [Desulfobacteraceae bacterium]